VVTAFALSVGVLAFFVLGSSRSSFVSPGQLTDAHAEVLKTRQAEACGACHDAGSKHANRWVQFAVAPGQVQNDKCLACHRAALGRDAAFPHSLATATLASLTAAAPATPPRTARQFLTSFAPHAQTANGQLACATCHQEHGGRRKDLTQLSDNSCQACHKTQFESFAVGHPEFKAVRHNRAGIIFDHAAHEPRMPGGKLDCNQCHHPDSAARTMPFTGFDRACVGCHDQGKIDHHGDQIRDGVQVVFQLPSMTLDKPAVWPAAALAPGGQLTPMLQFLIAGDPDPAAVHALKLLSADVVANGSTDDWDADSKTKAQLGTAIERVVNELSSDDADASQAGNRELLRSRIARAAGMSKTAPAVQSLLDQLSASRDNFKSWQQYCLPQLAQDLASAAVPATRPSTAPGVVPATEPAATAPATSVATTAATTAPADNAAAASEWKAPGNKPGLPGWFNDTKAVSINYRPTHGDPLLKSCIDLLAAHARPAKIVGNMSDPDFLSALRVQLLKKVGVSCINCHEVQPEMGAYVVNWSAAGHATQAPGYVKFDHKPHLTLFMGDDKCSVCHKLGSGSISAETPPAAAPLFPTDMPNHNLGAHNKTDCASCHMATGSPETCLTCHVYHMSR
jgi:hypothetical protein